MAESEQLLKGVEGAEGGEASPVKERSSTTMRQFTNLDVDMFIERLLAYKQNPGKPV